MLWMNDQGIYLNTFQWLLKVWNWINFACLYEWFDSPFQMKVRPTVEPKNVKVTGPGVSSKGIPASIPADFVIDTTEAGYGDLQVQVLVST